MLEGPRGSTASRSATVCEAMIWGERVRSMGAPFPIQMRLRQGQLNGSVELSCQAPTLHKLKQVPVWQAQQDASRGKDCSSRLTVTIGAWFSLPCDFLTSGAPTNATQQQTFCRIETLCYGVNRPVL